MRESPAAVCAVCGNAWVAGRPDCPFCGSDYAEGISSPAPLVRYRTVNLERRLPRTAQALDRLEQALQAGNREGLKVLTLIHGYGSSGQGGAIREAVRRQLAYLHHQGRIHEFIEGEHFEGRSGRGRQLLRRFPFLAKHRDLGRANPGITLVVL